MDFDHLVAQKIHIDAEFWDLAILVVTDDRETKLIILPFAHVSRVTNNHST